MYAKHCVLFLIVIVIFQLLEIIILISKKLYVIVRKFIFQILNVQKPLEQYKMFLLYVT